MSPHRVTLVLLALAVALGSLGCVVKDAGPEEEDATDAPVPTESGVAAPHDEAAEAAEEVDWSFMTGRWATDCTLVDIDNDQFRYLGNSPNPQWECVVNGAEMVMQTADDRFTGVLKQRGEDRWVYEGQASFTDEDGKAWSSTIVVNAVQEDEDHFSGEYEVSAQSPVDGYLYTARWEFTADRMQ